MTRPEQSFAHAAATSTALLVWSNAVVPRLPANPVLRAGANVAALLVLQRAAKAAGMSPAELGCDRRRLAAGAGAGAAALATCAAAYSVALAVPVTRRGLVRAHAGGEPVGLLLRALLLGPVGNAWCEEAAFRGVLQGQLSRLRPRPAAVAVTAAVFGLWHVGPTMEQRREAPAAPGSDPLATVLVTTAGGLVLGWLRHRTGSLLAPFALHAGANSIGLLAAWWASRLEPGTTGQRGGDTGRLSTTVS